MVTSPLKSVFSYSTVCPTDILNLLCELIWQGSSKLKEPDLCKLKGLVPITTFVARASRWRIKHYIGVFFQKRNSYKTFLRNALGWFQCVARPDDVFDIDVTWNYKFLFISFSSYEQLRRYMLHTRYESVYSCAYQHSKPSDIVEVATVSKY